MAEEHGILMLWEELREEVAEHAAHLASGDPPEPADPEFLETAFTKVMADHLADVGELQDAESCLYVSKVGQAIVKVNGYALDHESRSVDLLTSLYRPETQIQQISQSEVKQALVRAVRFFCELAKGPRRLQSEESEQEAMLRNIGEAIVPGAQVRIVLLTNGILSDAEHEAPTHDGFVFKYSMWDLRRLYRCEASGLPYEQTDINVEHWLGAPLPCIRTPDSSADYTAYLAIIPGELLFQLYEEYGARILELNVRSFLQARGKVNQGIRDTLRAEPHRFLAYNNGISAIAESMEIVPLPEGGIGIKSIRGLQVVNGGQTLASIHLAKKQYKADLGPVFVQSKLTVVSNTLVETLVPKIARFANSQNTVNEADFSSNEPYHVELQKLSETTWVPGEKTRWYYERARGQYQVQKSKEAQTKAQKRIFESTYPNSQKFTKTDLAKYVHSWDQYPYTVGKGSQKNFIEFMNRLRKVYGKTWKPDQQYYCELIGKAILFKHVEKIARQMALTPYRANAVAYCIAYLAHRTIGRIDFTRIWEKQAVTTALDATLRQWLPTIHRKLLDSAAGRNPSEWAKREACWSEMQKLLLDVPDELQEELCEGQPIPNVGLHDGSDGHELSYEDRENIAKVMTVPADEWLRIHGWGVTSGELKEWQCGIAHTLSGYASAGWAKVPSAKQAKHAVTILQMASDVMQSGDNTGQEEDGNGNEEAGPSQVNEE